ncbi:MAG: hypothetical protein COA86_06575 [Kangiella sp.]|nr:MAG: hypothetical protein COA86_06575 [Kangiella sp.]
MKKKYTPCNSVLTTVNWGRSVGKNIFAALTTVGLASGFHVAIDKEKIAVLAKSLELFDLVADFQKEKINQKYLVDYRKAFHSALTYLKLDAFILKYSGRDPDDLINRAIVLHNKAKISEKLALVRLQEAELARKKSMRDKRLAEIKARRKKEELKKILKTKE